MNIFFSIALTIFFVIDAFGHIPAYLSFMKHVEKKKAKWIALRELLFALVVMVVFNYLGQILLTLLNIDRTTVQISGGIILFLIAIRLIFSSDEDKTQDWGKSKPFIVPIATPLIAGPSVLAIIMIYAQEQPDDLLVLGAIFAAWLVSSIIFFFAAPIYRLVGDKTLAACQRLMGMIVALIAVQMFFSGVEGLFGHKIA